MAGTNIDGSTIGIAWIGVMCNDNWGYGLSQSQYTTDIASRVQLTAHELGHNWNACHCNQSGCTGGGTDSGALQRAGGGCRTLTFSCPTRYIHTVTEMTHKDDLFACRDLLAAWLQQVK